ncbi:MAG: Hsp20/alpha crystallin family protein [Candidatus Nealsonbacteria bacterium]
MSFFNKLKGEEEIEAVEVKKPNPKKKVKVKVEKKPETKVLEMKPEELELKESGELAIDVYEDNGNIVVQSTIGGIRAEDLDISIENDLLTIHGSREDKIEKEGKKYFYQECYWGSFMRKVILPEEVDSSKTKAMVKDGVLTLTMPKLSRSIKKKISVKQEE